MDQEIQYQVPGIRQYGYGYAIRVFAFCFLLFAVFFGYEIYLPHPASSAPIKIDIAAGTGSRVIGALLKSRGVIKSKWTFVTYVTIAGKASALKPGTYTFINAPISEIADTLVRGGADERVIVIPEGWSTLDIREYFSRESVMSDAAFGQFTSPAQAQKWNSGFAFLQDRPVHAGLEGYLFPDTYRVFLDAQPESVISKMLDNFGKKITPELRAEIRSQGKTLFEVLTMASLIEKEVVSEADRALVSGILWRRLDIGIPLQVDATVAYAKRQAAGSRQQRPGKISIEDTKIDSPYNTYRYRGLPPGPIANPGLSAIRAALHSQSSPYLYYLSAPDGRTIFSRTLDEHNAAKAKYLK